MNVAALKLDDLETVNECDRAVVLMHPLRLKILSLARKPSSSTEIGAKLGLPRQKVNYHVKELVEARFLKEAGQLRKRNMIEQQYVATANAYVISPHVLGSVAAGRESVEDKFSASYLIALGSQLQADLTQACIEAGQQEKRIATFSVSTDIRFESALQREEFARELERSVTETVKRFTSPFTLRDGAEAPGRPYRIVLGCYPIPKGSSKSDKEKKGGSSVRGNSERKRNQNQS